ncbi:hypothetical protein [Galbibacter sp. PAP.153]|uniref:hypothetical protein n=1 Tax=Galbibacter sp. PAP.153 TaxID=3104623 RepID=UPI00300A5723
MKRTLKSGFVSCLVLLCLALCTYSCKQSDSDAQDIGQSSSATDDGFKGKIELDIRDSKSDWAAYIPKSAPKGATNILFVLYDDTGLGAWLPMEGVLICQHWIG